MADYAIQNEIFLNVRTNLHKIVSAFIKEAISADDLLKQIEIDFLFSKLVKPFSHLEEHIHFFYEYLAKSKNYTPLANISKGSYLNLNFSTILTSF